MKPTQIKHRLSSRYSNVLVSIHVLASCTLVSAGLWAQEQPVEYEATPLSETVTMLKGRGGNIGISAGEDGVYLIDDQFPNIADQLLEQVRKISDKPIRFVINTHYHGDHTGGNEALGGAGAVIIAHDNIRKRMSAEQFNHFMNASWPASPAGALPVITFNETVSLHLNGESASVIHVPRGHTDGDAIVFFSNSNVLHMGDNFFNGRYPFIDLDGGGTVQGMIAALDKGISLASADTRIIPGHGNLASLDDLRQHRDMLATARDLVQALIDEGKTLDEAIAAKPTAEWDDTLGQVWIKPAQFVTFIYNSLTGVDHFTRIEANSGD
jgi:glyoxylase-like metal-dependent hydrolase (beta-lactamase superfamily II)